MSVELVPQFIRLAKAEASGKAPSRFLLLKDGDLDWAGSSQTFDADDAGNVIEAFEKHGAKLPIDYHHSSLKVEQGTAAKAPAAGWIGGMEFVEGEGLFATDVEWTKEAAAEIENKEFKYVSPVTVTLTATDKVIELHSVALTNRPRTKDMIELLQAAERAAASLDLGDRTMNPPKKTTTAPGDKNTTTHKAQNDGEEAMPVATEEQILLMKVAEALELEPDASREAILQAMLDKLGAGDETTEPTDEVPAAVKEAAEKAAKDLASLKVKATAFDGLAKRVKTLEGQLQTQAAEKTKAAGATLVQAEIEAGRLLPDDEEALKAATKLAETDPDTFTAIYASMPAIAPPGVSTASGRTHAVGNRATVISKASKEFDADPQVAQGGKKQHWINATLHEESMTNLTDAELKAIA